jgi:Spx/MgsR family transcriptional regulator
MITMYGIPNCDSIRKARRWLDDHGVAYRFHDYKRDGLDEPGLRAWVEQLGWEALLNRRGQTWRKLPEDLRERIDEQSAIRIMLETPSIIRRPLLDDGETLRVGFSEDDYVDLLR